jgi:putative effector of murein hydrolase LrgA (UPF0299 family)
MRYWLWFGLFLLIIAAMFLIMSLADNMRSEGPRTLGINSLSSLVAVLFMAGLLVHILRKSKR